MVTTNTIVGPHRSNQGTRPSRKQPSRKKSTKPVKQTPQRRPRHAPPIVDDIEIEQREEEQEIERLEAQTGDSEAHDEVARVEHNEKQNRTGEEERTNAQLDIHGIIFKPNSDQLEKYNKLVSRGLGNPCFVDMNALEILGVREQVQSLFDNIGWSQFLSFHEGIHPNIVFEFLSSVQRNTSKTGLSFRLNGTEHYVSHDMIADSFGFPANAKAFSPNDWDFRHYGFWTTIACGRRVNATYFETYDVSHSKASLIYNLSLRIAQRIIAYTILAREDSMGNCGSRELWILRCMLKKEHFNPVPWFTTQLTKQSKRTITTGGMVMILLRRLVELGHLQATLPTTAPPIPARYLTVSLLANSKFIGKKNRVWNALHLGSHLFPLPQPSRTDPYFQANLLPNPQPSVQFKHGEAPEVLPQAEIEIQAHSEIPILTPAGTSVHSMEFGQGSGLRVDVHTEHESRTVPDTSMSTTASTSSAMPTLGAPHGLTPTEQILCRLVDQQTIFMQQLAEQREQQLETRRTVDILLQTQIALLARLEQAPAQAQAPIAHPLLPLQAPMPSHLQAVQLPPQLFDPAQFLQLQDPPDRQNEYRQQTPPHP